MQISCKLLTGRFWALSGPTQHINYLNDNWPGRELLQMLATDWYNLRWPLSAILALCSSPYFLFQLPAFFSSFQLVSPSFSPLAFFTFSPSFFHFLPQLFFTFYGGPLVQFSRFAPRPISSSSFRLFSPASSLLPLSPPAFLTFSPSFFLQLFSLSPLAFFTFSSSFFHFLPQLFFTFSPSFFHFLPQLFSLSPPAFFHFLPQLFSLSPPAFFTFSPSFFSLSPPAFFTSPHLLGSPAPTEVVPRAAPP